MGGMAITKAALARQAAREAATAKRLAQGDGGRAGWENRGPDAALAARQAAARAVNGPVGLARRLAKAWPDASDTERSEVIAALIAAGILGSGKAWGQVPESVTVTYELVSDPS